ncbi:MAG TPA: BBP7 family outer membrane beta-barrel protein [Gemmataceae bacterium]|nr:BBP7 family outer membrane beta-barrel protein [Gemmataceae bacterium]
MCRGWKGLALVAACWWLHVPAQAQVGTYPSPVGAARMPEPIPCTPPPPSSTPPPNLAPGPISPQAAPMGPPDALSLPYDHTGAFQCEQYVQESGFYAHLGPIALQRNKLGAGDIAVVNANAIGQGTPFSIGPNPYIPPLAGSTSALTFDSVSPALSLGITGTLGYLWDNQAIEFTSFYIFQNNAGANFSQPGAIDTLFYNPPLTFLAPNLFRLVDSVSMTQGSSLFNGEFNYRRWNSAFDGLEFIFGLRYMRQNDMLGILSQENESYMTSWGQFTPGRDYAQYQVLTHNNIFAPQFGMEYNLPICRWLTLSAMGKVALGANYITDDVSLSRANGMTAFNSTRSAWNFGQIYQIGAFAYVNILERLRLKLGYTSMWLCGVATSVDQVDFNLGGVQSEQAYGATRLSQTLSGGNISQINQIGQSVPHGNTNNNGSLMYFGPLIELQFFF